MNSTLNETAASTAPGPSNREFGPKQSREAGNDTDLPRTFMIRHYARRRTISRRQDQTRTAPVPVSDLHSKFRRNYPGLDPDLGQTSSDFTYCQQRTGAPLLYHRTRTKSAVWLSATTSVSDEEPATAGLRPELANNNNNSLCQSLWLSRHVLIIAVLLITSIGVTSGSFLKCFSCHSEVECAEGRCTGNACVKTFVSVVDYVSKGCVNRTYGNPHGPLEMGCRTELDFMGFPTTICYCNQTSYCNTAANNRQTHVSIGLMIAAGLISLLFTISWSDFVIMSRL